MSMLSTKLETKVSKLADIIIDDENISVRHKKHKKVKKAIYELVQTIMDETSVTGCY